MEVELCGYKVLIDSDDYDKIMKFKWHLMKKGKKYIGTSIWDGGKSRTLLLHRCIMGLKGYDKNEVDHINGNELDNRKQNLRICTHWQNQYNFKKPKTNTTGFKGVVLLKTGKYVAQISVKRRHIHLGTFSDPFEAHTAYCEASKKYHGEFGRTE